MTFVRDMSPIIRPGTRQDLSGVLELYRHLHPNDPQPDAKEAEAAWKAILRSELMTVFIAEFEGIPISSCTLTIMPNVTRGVRPYALIENVVTHADYRRRGLGRSVLAVALDAAWDAGCYKVMLATGSRRPETLRFYEGAGFERGGKTFFEAKPGQDGPRPQTDQAKVPIVGS